MNHYEGDNFGSLAKVESIEHFNVKSLNPVTLMPGAAWKNIPFKEETGQKRLKTDDTENGTVYNYSGSFFISNIRKEVETELNPFLGQMLMLRVTDMNGLVSIIGAPGMPVTLKKNHDTGKKYTNENGTEFIFEIDQSFPELMLV
ncbi:hypothetical protein DBR40_24780 [Pedobacter sp. KBW01]|uniref:hypothetical protein n=1 Tax=Pedobacter sp. KBW01 TaxID=2153364 RepID=UPI000F5B270C|nr:hypothetical protein [Pedobacter sp. KBW01]RQO65090.1 hypothetical protein DBR40_24780 [Pedobacter sp. KBW01]